MIFSPDEIRSIRQGRKTATLTLPSDTVQRGRVRRLRRVTEDENGQQVRSVVLEPHGDGEMRPVMLTILAVTPIDITDLSLKHAQWCGYRTMSALRDAWTARHPNAPLALLVQFAVGDVRDRDRYMGWTGRAGGDYTANRFRSSDPEAPALSREQLDELAARAGQRHAKRQVDRQRSLASESPSQRLARLEAAGERARAQMARELRVISQRVERFEKRDAA